MRVNLKTALKMKDNSSPDLVVMFRDWKCNYRMLPQMAIHAIKRLQTVLKMKCEWSTLINQDYEQWYVVLNHDSCGSVSVAVCHQEDERLCLQFDTKPTVASEPTYSASVDRRIEKFDKWAELKKYIRDFKFKKASA